MHIVRPNEYPKLKTPDDMKNLINSQGQNTQYPKKKHYISSRDGLTTLKYAH